MLDFIHLSTTGVAEIAKSTNLMGCPHTFVYVVYIMLLMENCKSVATALNSIAALNLPGAIDKYHFIAVLEASLQTQVRYKSVS